MPRFFLFGLLFFLFFIPGFGQSPKEFHIRQFTTENGLPSNGIKGLQWDEQTGFLWIATEAGIVRYNGMEFKVYSKEDDPHITNERVLFLVRNNAGKIFTADYNGNIFQIEKNKLVFFEKKKLFDNPGSNIISIVTSEALYRTNIDFAKPGPFSLQFARPLPSGDTACFVIHTKKLFYYSISSQSPTQVSPAGLSLNDGFKIGNNFFVVDSQRHVYQFDPLSHRFTPTDIIDEEEGGWLYDKRNLFIWENGRKNPILFNKGKAWILSFHGGKLKGRLICSQVPEDILVKYASYDEKKKTVFIGTDSKGIIIIGNNRVESLKLDNPGSTRTSYYAQLELPDGNILTNEGHIIGKNPPATNALPLKGKFSNSIFLMGDSLLWFSQLIPKLRYNCLCNYNFYTGKVKIFDKVGPANENVMAVSRGQVYYADYKGIFRVEGDTLHALYRHPEDNYPRLPYDMKEIEPGILAVASCNALLRFDTRTFKLDTIFNSGNYCVRTIWQYRDYIFFGTYGGGLFIYKSGRVKALPTDKSNYLLYTHCFVEDREGYCWISTNKGLFKASLSALIQAFDTDNTTPVYYYYFGKNDGMEMPELNGGCTPCALLKKDKTISFPTMDGLLWVDPEKAMPVLPEGEIYFDNILIDGKLINPDSLSLEKLPAQTGEIIIRMAISAWSNKENIYVWYQLNNDSEWRAVNIEKGMEIRFNNLRPGHYKLRIRKQNGFGIGNYTYKELAFYITVPWFKRWWFNLLLLGVLAGLFMLFYNSRTRQLRKKQQRLERLVAEKTKELQQKTEVLEKNDTIKTKLISIISHDIVTPLKFLTVAGKNLVDKREQMPEELQQETIREMVNTSQELQLLSTNILNWIKYQNENRRLAKENFNVHELADQVLGVLRSLAKQKNLELHNETEAGLVIHQYYEPLKILVFNLVSNAINFTEQGSIIIGNSQKQEGISIFVKDGGVGMTPEQIQNIMANQFIVSSANMDNRKGNGLGYLIIKDLVKMMGATLRIESEKGRGTTVSVFIPITNNK